jgi:hypothetical protein
LQCVKNGRQGSVSAVDDVLRRGAVRHEFTPSRLLAKGLVLIIMAPAC